MPIMDRLDIRTKDHVGLQFSFAIVISLLSLTRISVRAQPESILDEAVAYFKQYGYLPQLYGSEVQDSEVFLSALQHFQEVCGVNKTGILDAATIECLNRPRCGNRDFVPENGRRRKRRYYIPPEGESWVAQSTHMTYDVVMYSDDLPHSEIDESIARAFELWSNSTNLTFQRIRGGDVDISILFFPSFEEHGDNMPFDGPGRVLAHAFWPWSEHDRSDVHLDEAETWSVRSYTGANLWLVAAHEIGHALGLGHSFVFGTLMFPFHLGYIPDFTLHEDDIAGIQALYGHVPIQPAVLTSTPGYPPDAPDICRVHMDAIMVDGFTYIFKGDFFWKVLNGRPEPGYPQRISARWPGLEGDIDAAFTVKNDYVWKPHTGKTYFFKDRRVWRYTLSSLDAGFPADAAQVFPGFPDDILKIKGILEISGNGETYIFTDNGFYVYSWLGFQGPYGLQVFQSVPANIVAAVQWTDNYIYFFADDGLYYQCSPWSFTLSRGYPRFANMDWLGCSNNLILAPEQPDDVPQPVLEGRRNLTETSTVGSSARSTLPWTFTAISLISLTLSVLSIF